MAEHISFKPLFLCTLNPAILSAVYPVNMSAPMQIDNKAEVSKIKCVEKYLLPVIATTGLPHLALSF